MSWCARVVSVALLLWVGVVSSGCVYTYQPLSGLHDPVIVDINAPNFQDVDLTLRCEVGDILTRGDARQLCRKLEVLFDNQGATVTVDDTSSFSSQDLGDEGGPTTSRGATELLLVVRVRETNKKTNPITWVAAGLTGSLSPVITERSFAQEIVIRDGTGFLLVRDTLEGRIIRYMGIGTWAGNKLLDWLWRESDEELTGNAANEDITADIYGKTSQLLFNAKMRAEVLRPRVRTTTVTAPLPDASSLPEASSSETSSSSEPAERVRGILGIVGEVEGTVIEELPGLQVDEQLSPTFELSNSSDSEGEETP